MQSIDRNGISMIISTNKRNCISTAIDNYTRQKTVKKELILILNSNDIQLEEVRVYGKDDPSIHIYQLDEKITLGACLNYAVEHAKYAYVTKADDDDYYGEHYLKEVYDELVRGEYQIVGKDTAFVYLIDDKILCCRRYNVDHCAVQWVAGGTISFTKELFLEIQFPEINMGEDSIFEKTAIEHGYEIYMMPRYNYIYIRHNDLGRHTWKPDYAMYKGKDFWDHYENMSMEDVIKIACK